jgi:hypothetical protein
MNIPRTEADLQSLIVGQVEESISLDYKHAAALSRDDKKRDEITKDVSAFANSAGGIIIYGIAEAATAKHLPEGLTPVDRTQYSKEWLEQVIHRIQPKIEGIEVIPIPLSSATNHVAYAVSIPQGNKAHQAADKRYYKRHNFMAVPMEDYELRDVMNRLTHPIIELEAEIVCDMEIPSNALGIPFPYQKQEPCPRHLMNIRALNRGKAIAHHVICFAKVPIGLLDMDEKSDDGRIFFNNHMPQFTGDARDGFPRYGNPQWMPILPKLSRQLHSLRLRPDFYHHLAAEFTIPWFAFCDTSPERSGQLTNANVNQTLSEEYRQFVSKL